jgi:hypothetical protein
MGHAQSKPTNPIILGGHKVRGIQLPGQSGKTRKMEEKITQFRKVTRANHCEDDINIMITSNNKILVDQTSTRLDDDLGPSEDNSSIDTNDETEDDEVILSNGASTWTSSDPKSTDPKALFAEIMMEELDMVVCCANGRRFKKIVDLITMLEKCPKFTSKINIWIDEAHKSVKLWKKYIFEEESKFPRVLEFKKVYSVILVTASWDPIDKHFQVHRYTYEMTHPEVYRSLRECNWKLVEPDEANDDDMSVDESNPFDMSNTAPGYLKQILDDPILGKRINTPGTHWLTPGNSRTATHDAIEEHLLGLGWNGLKLQGKEKVFHVYGNRIDYTEYNKQKQEPKDVIAKLFREYPSLQLKPFFVTGLNCIKEGITFQGEGFMFNGAVLPPMSSPSDAYQLACRLAGNLKSLLIYKTYETPLIITTARMQKKILRQENINIFLPRILYEEGRTLPTESDKLRAARGHISHDPKGYGYRIFSSYDSYIGYVKAIGRKTGFKGVPNGSGSYTGKYVCAVPTVRSLSSIPRYLTEVIDNIDKLYGGKGADTTGKPCYLDVTNAPAGLVWVVVLPESDGIYELVQKADEVYPDQSKILLSMAVPWPREKAIKSAGGNELISL